MLSEVPHFTNVEVLNLYSLLPFQELLLRLENKELMEEGMRGRDLALGCLVTFHHFAIDKALGGVGVQKRVLPFKNPRGGEVIDLSLFPGLVDDQFHAISQYARTEKWPLTPQGLFFEIQRSSPIDPTLLEAFVLTPEYHVISTLFAKTGTPLATEQMIAMMTSGEWTVVADFVAKQRAAPDFSLDARRYFLLELLKSRSKLAAAFLLDADLSFALKRLDDSDVLTILDLLPEQTPSVENFAKGLLASMRADVVWKRAAALLYRFAGESLQEPYQHQAAISRFLPGLIPVATPQLPQVAAPLPPPQKKTIHTVQVGENLWKIARKYQVSVEEIKRLNQLETEKIRTGKKLEIPQKGGSS